MKRRSAPTWWRGTGTRLDELAVECAIRAADEVKLSQSLASGPVPITTRSSGCHLPAQFWSSQRVSSVRDLRPVFVRILRTWLSTVRSERTNLLATSRFDKA